MSDTRTEKSDEPEIETAPSDVPKEEDIFIDLLIKECLSDKADNNDRDNLQNQLCSWRDTDKRFIRKTWDDFFAREENSERAMFSLLSKHISLLNRTLGLKFGYLSVREIKDLRFRAFEIQHHKRLDWAKKRATRFGLDPNSKGFNEFVRQTVDD